MTPGGALQLLLLSLEAEIWKGTPRVFDLWAKYSKLPVERIRYQATADEGTVRSIDRGVLFLMAFWSVPSVREFAKLTEVLASLPSDDLELVVVDVDGSAALYELPEFKGLITGAGETAWVRDGRIVATSGLGMNVECFKPNTLALLSMAIIVTPNAANKRIVNSTMLTVVDGEAIGQEQQHEFVTTDKISQKIY